jgi:hypothetical protein
MTSLRYPLSALFMDYVLGISGTAICLVMVITSGWSGKLTWLFILLTLCCLAYTMRTILQHKTVIAVDEGGVTRQVLGSAKRIDWDRLQAMSLRYYARRRPKKKGFGGVLGKLSRAGFDDKAVARDQERSPFADGWMVLTLRGTDGQRITLESGLPHFFALTERAAKAARQNNIELDPVSDDNLRALASLPADLLNLSAQPLRAVDPFSGSNLSGPNS